MIVLFLNEGPPVGSGGCRNGTLWGGGNPSEPEVEVGC